MGDRAGGEGTERPRTSGGTPLRWRRGEGVGHPRAGGREERYVENKGPIPDASLWLPQPSASRYPTARTEGGRGDPAISPFPPFPQRPMSFQRCLPPPTDVAGGQ